MGLLKFRISGLQGGPQRNAAQHPPLPPMNAHGQVHPHRPSAAVAAAASVERARRASTGGAHLRRGSSFGLTLRAIFAGPNAPGEDEDEDEAAPVTQKQKIDRALKLVMDLVKGPVGTKDRTGLPKKVRELVEGLLRDGELATADEREVWCKSMLIMSDLHLESQMSKGQVKRDRSRSVASREVSLLKKLHHPNRPRSRPSCLPMRIWPLIY